MPPSRKLSERTLARTVGSQSTSMTALLLASGLRLMITRMSPTLAHFPASISKGHNASHRSTPRRFQQLVVRCHVQLVEREMRMSCKTFKSEHYFSYRLLEANWSFFSKDVDNQRN